MADDRARDIWRRALARDGQPDPPLVSLLADWSEFAQIEYPEMLSQVFSAQDRIDSEWQQQRPGDPETVAAFYDKTSTMVPLLVWWHGTDINPARNAAAATAVMSAIGARRALDFGCGIGTTALTMAAAGIDVLLADVSQQLLELAAWRVRRRGHATETHNLLAPAPGLKALPAASVDAITAFDVFEHIPDATADLEQLDRVLADDGVICFNQAYVPDDDELQHYPQCGEVLRWLHERGYRLAHVRFVCWIAQKAPLPTFERRLQAAELGARIAVARVGGGRNGATGRQLDHHLISRALR